MCVCVCPAGFTVVIGAFVCVCVCPAGFTVVIGAFVCVCVSCMIRCS